MENHRETRNHLKWHQDGRFEVLLINGVITKLEFCEPGKGPKGEDIGKCLTSTDFKFLKAVRDNLIELFKFMDEENKRQGHRYAGQMDDEAAEDHKEIHLKLLHTDHGTNPNRANGHSIAASASLHSKSI